MQFLNVTYIYLSSDIFRIINFISIVLSYVNIVQLLVIVSNSFLNSFSQPYSGSYMFTQFNNLIILRTDLRIVLAFNLMVIFMRLLQFFKFSKKLSLLTDILSSAKLDIGFFIVMFMIILFSFALMGYLMLGHFDQDFETLGDSIVTCYNMLLGSFNTSEILAADNILGGIYFVVYMILFRLLLLNMFIAIVSAHYKSVKEEAGNKKVRGFFAEIFHVIRKHWRKKMNRVHVNKTNIEEQAQIGGGEDAKETTSEYSENDNYVDQSLVESAISPNSWVFKLENIIKTKTSNALIFSRMLPENIQKKEEILVKPASESQVLVLNETIWSTIPAYEKLKIWRRLSIMWDEQRQKKVEFAAVKEREVSISALSKLQQKLWETTSFEDKIQLWIGEHRFDDEERIAIWNVTKFTQKNLSKLPLYESGVTEQAELIEKSSIDELETWVSGLLSPTRKHVLKLMKIENSRERLAKIQSEPEIFDDPRVLLWAGLSMSEKQHMFLSQPDPKEATLLSLMIIEDIGENVIMLGEADSALSILLDGQVHNKYFELAIYESERFSLNKCRERLEDALLEQKNTQNYFDYMTVNYKDTKSNLDREIMRRQAIIEGD